MTLPPLAGWVTSLYHRMDPSVAADPRHITYAYITHQALAPRMQRSCWVLPDQFWRFCSTSDTATVSVTSQASQAGPRSFVRVHNWTRPLRHPDQVHQCAPIMCVKVLQCAPMYTNIHQCAPIYANVHQRAPMSKTNLKNRSPPIPPR